MVDIVHEYGKEAMMFMGDHWIGMEPFMDEFASIGLDAVVGSVGNGATLRLFSDIETCKIYRRTFLAVLLPGYLPRGRRSGQRGKSKLGDSKKSYPSKPDPDESDTAVI